MKTLTQEEVRRLLDYDPETGELRWKEWKKGRKMDVAVGATSYGYLVIRINGRLYRNHRVIWLWYYGYFPENEIDHINRVKSDNRLSNLREVSHTCNSRNCGMDPRNKTGVRGVSWIEKKGKWQVSIKAANKFRDLGRYEALTEAVAHRLAAEQCLNWEGCDSSSSAYQYMNSIRRQQNATHKL